MPGSSFKIRTLFTVVTVVLLVATSCKKNDQTLSLTSSISGMVKPVSTTVKVIAIRDTQRYVTVADNAGRFILRDLPPGKYTLTAVSDTAFFSSHPVALSLQSGQHAAIGTLLLIPNRTGVLLFSTTPVLAVSGIKITNQAYGNSIIYQPATTSSVNSYNIVLPEGTYTLSVVASAAYQPPPDTTFTLAANQKIVLPVITLVPVYTADGGRVSGAFAPPGVVTTLTLKNMDSFVQYALTPNNTGKFSFANVVPGPYTLSGTVSFNSGYSPPLVDKIVVHSNQPVDLGTISLLPDHRALTYYINDTVFRKTNFFTGSLGSSGLRLTGSDYWVNGTTAVLTLGGFNGPGQYACSSVTGTSIQYQVAGSTQFDNYVHTWSSNNPGGSGTITVTDYDPVAGKVSGTFSGTVQSASTSGIAMQKISKGVFTDMTHQ